MKRKETQIWQTAILEASTQFCDMIHLAELDNVPRQKTYLYGQFRVIYNDKCSAF